MEFSVGEINQSFRATETKSKQEYDVYKMIKDAMERMYNTGHEIDEAVLELEIPPDMLRNNPSLVDRIGCITCGIEKSKQHNNSPAGDGGAVVGLNKQKPI